MEKKSLIGLNEELNPEYYSLQNEANALFERWNKLNTFLAPFRVKRFPFFNSRPHLHRLFEPYTQLQADSNFWLKRAEDFFRKHPPIFLEGQDQVVNLLWLQRELDQKINSMQVNKFINSYYRSVLENQIDQRQNFIIAIVSFVMAIIGLSIAF